MNTHKKVLLLSSDLKPHSEDEQCDCACAQTFGSNFDISTLRTPFISLPELYYQVINNDYRLAFNPKNNADIAVINSSVLDILESFRYTRKIRNTDDVEVVNKMIKAGLLSADEMENQGLCNFSPQVLSSWLHLTDRCNLRCSYCYLPHVREDMSSETGKAVIDAIFRSAITNKFQQVKLKYAGGESLLRYPLILELHFYARQLAEVHGLSLEEVVLSNGTLLTDEMAKTLKLLDIRLMISMDGKGHYHDSQRPYAGGRGSFKDVSDSVDRALFHGLVPNISVTVSSRTAEGLPDIMGWILERELPFSLNFYRENELSASHVDMQLDEQKIIDGMKGAFKVIEDNLPRRGFLGGIIDRANLSASHTHTCGVGQNYLVFDQNGQVAKCQMHIRKPITNIHVEDPLAVIRADQIGIQNISVEEKEGCKTCKWKYWCTGGCSLATYRATGRYDVKSPNCNIYKALYPEALRLEGLRLLKYQDDPEVIVAL
jgi:uncharacterized protein